MAQQGQLLWFIIWIMNPNIPIIIPLLSHKNHGAIPKKAPCLAARLRGGQQPVGPARPDAAVRGGAQLA